MATMRASLLPWFVLVLAIGLRAQAPAGAGGIRYDSRGWPIVPGETTNTAPANGAAAAPAGETASSGATPVPVRAPFVPTASSADRAGSDARPPSGMQLGSPLLEIYQATRAPGAFKALGGISVWWRLTIYGVQGEIIGLREVTHTADCAYAERDRLEFADGRIYGRVGASVFAERQGMPWPTLAESAQHELALFGLHLRLPWCFADANSYAVRSRDVVERDQTPFARLSLERRPPPELDVLGPQAEPKPRDWFEVIYQPTTGTPHEFVHRFASSRETRRILLEDWRDHEGVRLPFRRVYVDETLRQTTTMEILRLSPARVSERDFRLH